MTVRLLISMALVLATVGEGGWLRELYGRPAASSGDVLAGALLVAEEPGWKPDGAWALERAQARGWVRRRQHVDPATPATRAFAAQVFAAALKIKGGVWMRTTGGSARYAYRELVLLGMLPEHGPTRTLTGDELAGLMLAAERYRQVGPERPLGTAP